MAIKWIMFSGVPGLVDAWMYYLNRKKTFWDTKFRINSNTLCKTRNNLRKRHLTC